MTKQELELYLDPVLQAFFETVKGEWRNDDMVIHICGNDHPFRLTLPLKDNWNWHENFKWLPKPIDTENPERGLCGMLGKSWYLSCREGIYCCYAGQYSYEADTPTAALLIALRERVGGK
jgi:hypothetical protein